MCVIWARWCPVSGVALQQKRRAWTGRRGARVTQVDDRSREEAGGRADGRVAQRVSSAAWARGVRPMAGHGGRAISRAGSYNVAGAGGLMSSLGVRSGWREAASKQASKQVASKQGGRYSSTRLAEVQQKSVWVHVCVAIVFISTPTIV